LASIAEFVGIEPKREHLTAALLVVPVSLLLSSAFFLWGARKRDASAAKQLEAH
jgi:cytochrome c-type biogenesis protein CcmH/NrfF